MTRVARRVSPLFSVAKPSAHIEAHAPLCAPSRPTALISGKRVAPQVLPSVYVAWQSTHIECLPPDTLVLPQRGAVVMPAAPTAFTQIHTASSYPRTWGRCRHLTTRMPIRNRSSARTKARLPQADPCTGGTWWPLTPNMYVGLSDTSFLCVYFRCMYVCMYVCMCVCMCVCVHVGSCLCLHVWMYSLCSNIHIYSEFPLVETTECQILLPTIISSLLLGLCLGWCRKEA